MEWLFYGRFHQTSIMQKLGVGQAADTIAELHWRPDDRAIAALDRQGGVNVWRI